MPASFLLISDSLQTQLVKMKGNFRILFTIHFVVFDAKQLKLFEVFHFSMSLLCSLSCCSLINLSSHFLSFSFSQFFILPSASPFFFFSCQLFAFILLLHRFTSAAGHQFSISFIFFIFLLASFSTLFLFFCLFSIFSHETAPPRIATATLWLLFSIYIAVLSIMFELKEMIWEDGPSYPNKWHESASNVCFRLISSFPFSTTFSR